MLEITWISAMIAGVLSFLSPCVLPIVPPFLCYMSGVKFEELRKQTQTWQENRNARITLLRETLLFVCGFTCIFVSLGATAWTVGSFLLHWKSQAAFMAGLVILLLGINFLGIIHLSFLWREIRFHPHNFPVKSLISFIIGGAFAFSWTPCIGPILGTVLVLAGSRETAGEGVVLLIFYSLGLGIPFLLVSFFLSIFMHLLARSKRHFRKIEKGIGLFLIIIGFSIATGQMKNISSLLGY